MIGSAIRCVRTTSSRSNTTASGAGSPAVEGRRVAGRRVEEAGGRRLRLYDRRLDDLRFTRRGHPMNTLFRVAAVALLVVTSATPAPAQPRDKPIPEPLPMGVPYVYQPGNN